MTPPTLMALILVFIKMVEFKKFQTTDISYMTKFMLKNGKNQWNDIS